MRPAADPWDVIVAQRLTIADLLESLTAAQWAHPSLCTGWTVHDVAAHLTMQQMGLVDVIAVLGRWRGSMDRTVEHAARRRAAELPAERIVAEIRDTAGHRRHTVGVTPLETLIDLLVHAQDIALPLGRRHEMPPAAAALAATRLLTMRWPPPPPAVRAVAGFRLVATDVAWTAGDGPEVRGPMAALLLTCTGRRVATAQLGGAGATALTARLAM